MSKLIDLRGQKFERLTIIKRVGSAPNGSATWLCKCECGIEKVIRGDLLRDGNTRSCGCLNKETASKSFRKDSGLSSMRQLIINYKGSARRRGYEYKLTEEQFSEITKKKCYYCGLEPDNIEKTKGCNGNYIYNGLDRIDNTKGYTIDNVVSCCKICNQAKHTLTIQEFKNWVEKIYNNMKRK